MKKKLIFLSICMLIASKILEAGAVTLYNAPIYNYSGKKIKDIVVRTGDSFGANDLEYAIKIGDLKESTDSAAKPHKDAWVLPNKKVIVEFTVDEDRYQTKKIDVGSGNSYIRSICIDPRKEGGKHTVIIKERGKRREKTRDIYTFPYSVWRGVLAVGWRDNNQSKKADRIGDQKAYKICSEKFLWSKP